ncbi:hypothetical protein JKP88DRAFT_266119 [Tribonema minus]|uniref:Uncharacterized protein n=1 Tax=Tribonema minus TaxID=303371 RepID=A0A835ZKF6_9STRA|nr:hypothetical protein JKP88DRAFT_266119 [Tribonema minus]
MAASNEALMAAIAEALAKAADVSNRRDWTAGSLDQAATTLEALTTLEGHNYKPACVETAAAFAAEIRRREDRLLDKWDALQQNIRQLVLGDSSSVARRLSDLRVLTADLEQSVTETEQLGREWDRILALAKTARLPHPTSLRIAVMREDPSLVVAVALAAGELQPPQKDGTSAAWPALRYRVVLMCRLHQLFRLVTQHVVATAPAWDVSGDSSALAIVKQQCQAHPSNSRVLKVALRIATRQPVAVYAVEQECNATLADEQLGLNSWKWQQQRYLDVAKTTHAPLPRGQDDAVPLSIISSVDHTVGLNVSLDCCEAVRGGHGSDHSRHGITLTVLTTLCEDQAAA